MLLGHTRLSIIDPDRVRDAFSMVKMLQGDQKIAFEGLIHKVASITLMQERFGMTQSVMIGEPARARSLHQSGS